MEGQVIAGQYQGQNVILFFHLYTSKYFYHIYFILISIPYTKMYGEVWYVVLVYRLMKIPSCLCIIQSDQKGMNIEKEKINLSQWFAYYPGVYSNTAVAEALNRIRGIIYIILGRVSCFFIISSLRR